QREPPARRPLRVDRFDRLPRLAVEGAREVRREEVWLRHIHAHAAIERRPFPFDAGVARAAQEIEVLPLDARTGLLLGAAPNARPQPLMLRFADGDYGRNLRRRAHLIRLRLDVDELEELQAVQLVLAVAHLRATVDISLLEGQLAPDDVLANALDTVEI